MGTLLGHNANDDGGKGSCYGSWITVHDDPTAANATLTDAIASVAADADAHWVKVGASSKRAMFRLRWTTAGTSVTAPPLSFHGLYDANVTAAGVVSNGSGTASAMRLDNPDADAVGITPTITGDVVSAGSARSYSQPIQFTDLSGNTSYTLDLMGASYVCVLATTADGAITDGTMAVEMMLLD